MKQAVCDDGGTVVPGRVLLSTAEVAEIPHRKRREVDRAVVQLGEVVEQWIVRLSNIVQIPGLPRTGTDKDTIVHEKSVITLVVTEPPLGVVTSTLQAVEGVLVLRNVDPIA